MIIVHTTCHRYGHTYLGNSAGTVSRICYDTQTLLTDARPDESHKWKACCGCWNSRNNCRIGGHHEHLLVTKPCAVLAMNITLHWVNCHNFTISAQSEQNHVVERRRKGNTRILQSMGAAASATSWHPIKTIITCRPLGMSTTRKKWRC